MKLSENWLREWVNPAVDTDTLVQQLTMAGLEVDGVEPAAGEFSGIVVGHVLTVTPHPNADKLHVTEVDAGTGETLQIVCGAANVRVGLKTPCALVGARMPGFAIKKAKLRGVESRGMLCSEEEMGIAEFSEGLMELPADAPVGQDLRVYLGLDDVGIDIDLTPNRGDCLSVAGIAREVGVLNGTDLTPPSLEPVTPQSAETFPVRLEAPADCPRYLGRVIRGIDPRAETPLWMVEKLRRSGIRSLGPGVDVTNYVLLELGQPMHAFDLARLRGGIVVRRAARDEALTLLDGKTVKLDDDVLVIAHAGGAVAMAGIMGGEGTGVSEVTRDIFLEAAHFAPIAVAGRARRFGLHTDASHRFERGVDPELPAKAMERATRLLIDICGGAPGPVVVAESREHLSAPKPITLRRDRIRRLLGLRLEDAQMVEYLQRLGMQVEAAGGEGWRVRAPSARFDIAIEADLIEELGRIHGYDHIPNTLPHAETAMAERPEARQPLARVRSVLVDRGWYEAITYSFVDPAMHRHFMPGVEPIPLANPISQDLSVMRTSLWPGLMTALQHNLNRQQTRVRLFETGQVFLPGKQTGKSAGKLELEGMEPIERIAGIAMGAAHPEQWGERDRRVDFYDVKGDLEAVMGAAVEQYRFAAPDSEAAHPALHPGQCARIERRGRFVGWIGALHPALEKSLGLDAAPILFELEQDALTEGTTPVFQSLSRFPANRRDLAVLVDEDVTAEAVTSVAEKAGGALVSAVDVFDVYRGGNIESGRKSLAISLILLDSSRTLTDADGDAVVVSVVESLKSELGASLRE